ncbi:MAG: hypothetical protein AAGG80_06145 [Pseudomonadota bacterium]
MLNKIMMRIILLLTSALTLAGCATIASGSTQTINVRAIDSVHHRIIPGAKCVVADNREHVYHINTNPGHTIVSKGQGALRVSCRRHGYYQTHVGVGSSFNAWTIADIIFWPSAIVDVYSGAYQKYPSHITVIMARGHKPQHAKKPKRVHETIR